MYKYLALFCLGNDACPEPNMDCRVDESSDVPMLEDRSSSPVDFPQESWVVCADIENIERYEKQIRNNSFFSFSSVGLGRIFPIFSIGISNSFAVRSFK